MSGEGINSVSVGFRSRWKKQRYPTNPTKTKNPIIKGRPVDGSKSIESCVSMPVKIEGKYKDEDQTRTERPVGGQQSTQLEEIDIDFRVPGLSHEVV